MKKKGSQQTSGALPWSALFCMVASFFLLFAQCFRSFKNGSLQLRTHDGTVCVKAASAATFSTTTTTTTPIRCKRQSNLLCVCVCGYSSNISIRCTLLEIFRTEFPFLSQLLLNCKILTSSPASLVGQFFSSVFVVLWVFFLYVLFCFRHSIFFRFKSF